MPSLNKVLLIGHLGGDPELKYLPSGQGVATFSMATSRRWKDKDGNKQEDTQWHNVKVWGKRAEVVAQYLKKGSGVFVEGRIETRRYEKDGQTRYYTEVVVDDFAFMDKGEAQQSAQLSPRPQPEDQDDLPF